VLVVQGADDPYGTLLQVESIERQCGGPVRRCLLAECGHTPHRERRAPTLSAMSAFLREFPEIRPK
jgi:pimeloyl-ACP methyl ester carboxylesterase